MYKKFTAKFKTSSKGNRKQTDNGGEPNVEPKEKKKEKEKEKEKKHNKEDKESDTQTTKKPKRLLTLKGKPPVPHIALDIPEIWIQNVMPYFDARDLFTLGQVSRKFLQWSSCNSLWRDLFSNRFSHEAMLKAHTEEWKSYFLTRQRFSYLSHVGVHQWVRQKPTRHLFSSRQDDVDVTLSSHNVECGISAEKLCFLSNQVLDIKLSQELLILALYVPCIEQHPGNQHHVIGIEALPVLAFVSPKKNLHVVEYPDTQTRNEWLREIVKRVQPIIRMVVVDIMYAPQMGNANDDNQVHDADDDDGDDDSEESSLVESSTSEEE